MTYDTVADPQARWGADVLLRVAGGRRALDAGCGSGRVTEQLLDKFPDLTVVGVDRSAAMLSAAQDRLARFGDRVTLVQADLSAPLPDVGLFDLVFSTATFHWVRDHGRLFQRLARVLEMGGRLVAQWGGRGNIDSVVNAMRDLGLDSSYWHFADPTETAEHLREAGFTDIAVWCHADPATFATRAELERFLESVVLFEALAGMPDERRRDLIARVADRLGALSIDYVRLNAMAVRG
ncbi:class I SAM-dependent methyltransferase [Blastococcus saxobsidens]|uniref:Trans-aconitate 2-methyltransferase n=1 Tax=Blastococcus saxobsidens TaxID=138336 RepID=A0A4Q7Y4Q4_9ACTN|nr:class I SAM-dependent methyltransferase [Blastococcus saxobsidens]RZU30829.1 trans-aconitate 2-methyltransferase [Blastococcus saxobsidens]